MWFLRGTFQKLFAFAVGYAAASLAGCGNSCFVGFSNNGNGGIIIKGGNPPPVCTLNPAQGMVRATVAKVQVCEHCAPVMRVQHIYVLVRGIQIRRDATLDPESGGWFALAPELRTEPRRIDLVGDSATELLTEDPQVPADTYSMVRLQFAADTRSTESDDASGHDECGRGVSNCVAMADGRIEPLRFSTDASELLIQKSHDGAALIVIPGVVSELQIRFGLQAPETPQLAGEFLVVRETPTN